jgi:hypothetical protein
MSHLTSRINTVYLCLGLLIACESALPQAPPPPPGGASTPGESLREQGDIPGAIAEFEKGLVRDPADQRNIYNLACSLSINKQLDRCFKYLTIAVEMKPSIEMLTEPDLLNAREDQRWREVEARLIEALNAKPNQSIKDVEYAKALWRLHAWDQAFFTEIGIAGRKIGMKSSVVEALWKFKFMVQERNEQELDRLVTAKGWPRAGSVGREASMAAYLVAMHSHTGLQKKYLSAIKQICAEKELPWLRYALIYDRSLFNENKPQHYGTHTKYNEVTKSEELYPLEDESRVNEWRKEIGLPPLEEYLKQFNITFRPPK